ncbi:MFS transporter [Acidocella sp.]|jgi:MHS family alpha-ketoglutarate permease-like MFS transporter|uniref:MFS transporter n=1 Tax=Acidocella sp. TaxID=50710 RepID=UPI002F3EEE26
MSEAIDSGASVAGTRVGRQRTLWGGAFGHFIEFYDWSIYGFLAGIFAAQMFPAGNATVSLIASFAAFAVGFLGRPIGAFVLSPLADKYGRRVMLSATILMAGLGSLVVAICPTYAEVGIVAPLIIVLARLLQGFSAGGEYQIAISFLNEHAPTRNRAFAASPQQFSIGISVLVATAVAALTTKYLSPADLTAWGWRLPFLLGAVLSLFGFYLRSGLDETPTFAKQQRENARTRREVRATSIVSSLAKFPREVFIVFVVSLNGLQYYLWMIFLPTYAYLVGGLDRTLGFAGSILASITYCICVPLFAFISDRIGRKPFLIGAALCFLLFTYPLLSMLAVPHLTFHVFAFVAVVGAMFVSLNNAVLGTVFAELFPTRVRASGIGIPYAVCSSIFGGTAPMVAAWLHQLGGPIYLSLYVMVVCFISLVTHAFLTPETRGRSLD